MPQLAPTLRWLYRWLYGWLYRWLYREWHARLRQLAVLGFACMFSGSTLFAAEATAQTESELQAITEAISSIQEWLAAANASYTAEEANLRAAEVQVMTTLRRVSTIETELASTQSELTLLQREITALESAKRTQETLLQQLLRAAYISGDQSLVKLLLNQEDPATSARLLQYYRIYAESQVEALQQFQITLDSIAATNLQLQATVESLSQQQLELQREVTLLENRKQARQSAVQEWRETIAARHNELEQLQIDQLQLQQLVDEINQAVERMPTPADIAPFASRRGQLAKPVAGAILQRFGAGYGDGNLRRQGILLAAGEGTPVQAVHAGRIVFADWLRGAGLLIIIDHGDGYMSLYGNNQALSKSAGEQVLAGDIIATAGSSGGSDSPGVYFEIRHHGTAQNPANWVRGL